MGQLDLWAMQRMNIPQRFWAADYLQLEAGAKATVRRFVANFSTMLGQGVGFDVLGKAGSGRTSLGVVLLKAAYERGHTAYYTTVKDIRHSIKDDVSFDSDTSVLARCRAVDLLFVDDVDYDDLRNFVFGQADLEHLLVSRGSRGKSSVLVVNREVVNPADRALLVDRREAISQRLKGMLLPLKLTGESRKDTAEATLKRELRLTADARGK